MPEGATKDIVGETTERNQAPSDKGEYDTSKETETPTTPTENPKDK